MISIVITSFREPRTIGKAIESFTCQNFKEDYELIVASPDRETHELVKKYQKKNKRIKLFVDPGKGKSYALNLLLPSLKGDVIILSDGDVFVSENSVNEILKLFKDSKVGCVSGRPYSQNSRNDIFGYWSHMLCNAAHELRMKRNNKKKFLECSGYLWAFKNKVIKKFPLDVGEDTIVPIMFWIKGWRIAYAPEARVFVKYPDNLGDFLKQKRRSAGAHDNIDKYVSSDRVPKMKTFWNEALGGFSVFLFAQNLREFGYTFILFPFRAYMWANLYYNSKLRKRKYSDAWKRVESTK